MPRPVGHGRPGTRVFPDCWADTVASVIDGTHESAVTIGLAGGTRAWSDAARQSVTAAAAPVYDGPATLRPASESDGATDRVTAEEPVAVALYEVALPHPTTGIKAGHIVHVTASPDPVLVRRTLTVVHVEGGDRHATRLIRATLND